MFFVRFNDFLYGSIQKSIGKHPSLTIKTRGPSNPWLQNDKCRKNVATDFLVPILSRGNYGVWIHVIFDLYVFSSWVNVILSTLGSLVITT